MYAGKWVTVVKFRELENYNVFLERERESWAGVMNENWLLILYTHFEGIKNI
jgi:hypothetical protein